MNRATAGTSWPAPMSPRRGVPSDHSVRPVFYDLVIASKHGEHITLMQDVEGRAVGVAGRSRRGFPVPVVDEAHRDSDPLEDRVWRAYPIATNREHSRTP